MLFQRWNDMREQDTEEDVKKRQQQQLNQFYSTLSSQKVRGSTLSLIVVALAWNSKLTSPTNLYALVDECMKYNFVH